MGCDESAPPGTARVSRASLFSSANFAGMAGGTPNAHSFCSQRAESTPEGRLGVRRHDAAFSSHRRATDQREPQILACRYFSMPRRSKAAGASWLVFVRFWSRPQKQMISQKTMRHWAGRPRSQAIFEAESAKSMPGFFFEHGKIKDCWVFPRHGSFQAGDPSSSRGKFS